jgi:hypothetical protein
VHRLAVPILAESLGRGLVTRKGRRSAMNQRFMITAVAWAAFLIAAPVMAQQAVEGAGKIITAPAEVPKGTVEGTAKGAKKGAPVAGAVVGTAKGTGKAVRKTGHGTANVVEGTGKAVGGALHGLSGKEE